MATVFTQKNPIIHAEFRHQRYVIQQGRVGLLWIILAAAMVVPSLLMALAFTVVGIIAPYYPAALTVIPFADNSNAFSLALVLLMTMTIAMYAVVTLVTLGLSSSSIRREKDHHTWDNLRLTDVGAGRIVLGKWWASLKALNGDHGMVTVIRVGFVAFYLGSLAPMIDTLENLTSPNVTFVRSADYLAYFPLLLVLTLIYSFLDAGLTAALGILAAVPDDDTGAVTGSIALALRLMTMGAAGGWFALSLYRLHHGGIGDVLALSAVGIMVYGLLLALVLYAAQRWIN